MSTPARRRVVGALAVLATALVGTVAAAAPTQALTASRYTSPTATLRPALVAGSTDVANALRGQYRWLGSAPTPSTWTANDFYYRDQVYWGRLEQTKGTYDFRWIDEGLARAGAVGGKFGFRVMAYCPYCWMNSRPDFPKVTPAWLPLQPGTDIPDWNSETFLSSWEKLMAELGRRYGNDPRLGYVDVGGYGKYGEWWVDYPTQKITDDNGLRLVRAVNTAFPKQHVLINTMTTVDFTLKALATNPRMGLRTDSLGARNMNSMIAVDERLQSVWRTRPIYTEWAQNGEPVLGRDQVRQYHLSTMSSGNLRLTYDQMTTTQQSAYREAMTVAGYRYAVSELRTSGLVSGGTAKVAIKLSNLGTAPTYDAWNVNLVLRRTSGAIVATVPLGIDLRTVLPGTQTLQRDVRLPVIAPDKYVVALSVADPAGYLAPMRLANTRRLADGSHQLGALQVIAPTKNSARLLRR
ncbi:DUF4832 domain-containing protein [Oryzobacter sp. R7]|uniref:DUF4832 domain-containing protein n=1 Tax=Oryzobacter faecalis TaxID=3388656 RepID=UPI00398D4EB8